MAATTLAHWEDVLEQAAALEVPLVTQHVSAHHGGAAQRAPSVQKPRVEAPQESISDAWQEAFEAAERDRSDLEDQHAVLKRDYAKATADLNAARQRLNEMEVSMDALREVSEHSTADIDVHVAKAEARAQVREQMLEARLETSEREIARLTAQRLLSDVSGTTLGRELAYLDGMVGFLTSRLTRSEQELRASLHSQQVLRAESEEARQAATLTHLQTRQLQHQLAAQKRLHEELRAQLSGAQTWAHEAEEAHEESLIGVRYAAAEELRVQAKRMRVWESQLPQLLRRLHPDGIEEDHRSAAAAFVAEVQQLIEAERALLREQSTKLEVARGTLDKLSATMASSHVAALEAQVDEIQRNQRDLTQELEHASRRDKGAQLALVTSELDAAQAQLAEQRREIDGMTEWMRLQLATMRTDFDQAVARLVEETGRLTSQAAAEFVAMADAASDGMQDPWGQPSKSDHAPTKPHKPAAERGERASLSGALDAEAGSDGGSFGSTRSAATEASLTAEVRQLRARLAELEERLKMEGREALQRQTDAYAQHRRELAQSERWARQLEAQLEHTLAALAIERDEAAAQDATVTALRAELSEAAGGSRPHGTAVASDLVASAAALGADRAARRLARARAVSSTAVGGTGPSGGPTDRLLVGSLSPPEQGLLRPVAVSTSPALAKGSQLEATASIATSPHSTKARPRGHRHPQTEQDLGARLRTISASPGTPLARARSGKHARQATGGVSDAKQHAPRKTTLV